MVLNNFGHVRSPSPQFFSSLYIYQSKALQERLAKSFGYTLSLSLSLSLMGLLQSRFGDLRKKKVEEEDEEGPSPSSPAATPPVEDELERVFRLYDTNGDGKISAAELRDMMAKLGRPPADDHELEMMMKEADADGDGFINLAEFKDINRAGEGVQEADLREAFAVFDEDHDGKISASELRGVLKGLGEEVTTAQCRKMIRGVDRDGDGMVSFQEFKVMMTGGGRPLNI
ncbi:probable calcium-binding protein CML10 [Phoenix dactylifera]|uniref:Probable calcium-binding protein CML10 n=1 Tax=Phoenix dactylifera TaxID=42345 RepID=A0A8B7CL76_PHODC|nr:probable calcium-binding protein CML10 [Phoenix dactylifera]